MSRVHDTERGNSSLVTVLTREQDRKLRAAAWRHVRRIIGKHQANAMYASTRGRVED